MHYDNQHTAQYMAEQSNLEVHRLESEVKALKQRIAELEAFIQKLEAHLELSLIHI